jgi:hypothetical protein
LITWIIVGDEYRSLSSSSCSLLHSHYFVPLRPKCPPQNPIQRLNFEDFLSTSYNLHG